MFVDEEVVQTGEEGGTSWFGRKLDLFLGAYFMAF
jgi:hypothetical protein